MKKLSLSVISMLMIAGTVLASNPTSLSAQELKGLDLSGKYTGKRYQYMEDKKTIMQTFQYEFELKQEGDKIFGVSTIIKQNGDYADVLLRGMIVGDKLFFEEYAIKNQSKNEDMVWCYKSGALTIKLDADRLVLQGATNSYMADYYLPCTGGYTDLVKVDNSNTFTLNEGTGTKEALKSVDMTLLVYPNPFTESTKINYSLAKDAKVSLEVLDITGRRVAVLENGISKNTGSYSIDFNAKSYNTAAGILISKLTVDGAVHSSEMIQIK